MNIATSTLVPLDVTECLCSTQVNREKKMDQFINARILTSETDIFGVLFKPVLTTLNKPVISKQKQTIKTIDIDRRIFCKVEYFLR